MDELERRKAQALALARAKQRVQGGPVASETTPAPPASPIGKLGKFMQGVTDPFLGIAQGMANSGLYARPQVAAGSKVGRQLYGEMSKTKPADVAQGANQFIDEREQNYQARRGAAGEFGFDGWRMAGNISATAPLAFTGPAAAATTLPRALAMDTALGTLASTMMPVGGAQDDYWKRKGDQATTGALASLATGGILRGTGRVAAPVLDRGAQALRNKGISLTPGASFGGWLKKTEEQLRSVPVAGDAMAAAQRRSVRDFNRAVYDEVLAPLGIQTPRSINAGRGGVKFVGDKVSAAYDDLLSRPDMRFVPDQEFVASFRNLGELAQEMTEDDARRFVNIMSKRVAGYFKPNGIMDGQSLKRVESILGGLSKKYKASSPDLADAFKEAQSLMRENIQRQNPQYAEKLGNINKAWAMLSRMEQAAAYKGAREGIFSPDHLLSAIKAQDSSVRKRGYARGDSLLQEFAETAQNVIGDSYPDSGTTGRLMSGLAVGGYFEPTAAATYGALSLPYIFPNATRNVGRAAGYAASPAALAAGVSAGGP